MNQKEAQMIGSIENMSNVSEQRFWNFLKGKIVAERMGFVFHSTFFSQNGVDIAYMETSSWGAAPIYMILKNASDCNSLTTDFITTILERNTI